MEGSGSRLATAGEDLKIWGSPSFSLVHQVGIFQTLESFFLLFQFTPSATSHVSSNCWSPDTTCVASVLKGKEQILLTYCKKVQSLLHEITSAHFEILRLEEATPARKCLFMALADLTSSNFPRPTRTRWCWPLDPGRSS